MIYVIGIGPGSRNLMTEEAIAAIEDAEVIVGYKTYINLITEFIGDKEVVQNGMRKEITSTINKMFAINGVNKEIVINPLSFNLTNLNNKPSKQDTVSNINEYNNNNIEEAENGN